MHICLLIFIIFHLSLWNEFVIGFALAVHANESSSVKNLNHATATPTSMVKPHVVICGGGPAGSLCAMFLAKQHIKTTLLEQSRSLSFTYSQQTAWSAKSYSLNLNPRGLDSIEKVEKSVLESVKDVCMERKWVILQSGDESSTKKIPRKPSHFACTRSKLVGCLHKILREDKLYSKYVTVSYGTKIESVMYDDANKDENQCVVNFKLDGQSSSISCTHVIGADGKWSLVRKSLERIDKEIQSCPFEIQEEASFGIQLEVDQSVEFLKKWEFDATTVIRPSGDCKHYYLMVSPISKERVSMSMVCFDEISNIFPWLVPPSSGNRRWTERSITNSSDVTKNELTKNLTQILHSDFPHLFLNVHIKGANIHQRVSWLVPRSNTKDNNENEESNRVRYSDVRGRILLIGDAAHAMTPSMGEGCNYALEDAAFLMECLLESKSSLSMQSVTCEDTVRAFQKFGTVRPSHVIPIQKRSALASRNQ